MNSQLRLTLPLLADETACSYASRLAQRNNISNLLNFCTDLGLPYHGLRLGKDGALLQLSKLSGTSFEMLKQQTIAYIGRTSYEFGNVTARRLFEKRCLFRFCPKCLDADENGIENIPPYASNLWEFEVLQCCHRHKCLLVERDSKGSVDFVALHQNYVVDKKNLNAKRVKPSDLHLENYFIKRITQTRTGTWFDDIPINAVKAFCEYFGALVLFGPSAKRSEQTQLDWLRAGAHGLTLLAKDRRLFYEIANTLKSSNSFAVDRRRDDFGIFANWLHDQKKNSEYEFARDLFRNFIFDTYPLSAGMRVYGKALPKRRLHTIHSVIKEEKLSAPIFKAYLIENGYAERIEGSHLVKQTKQILAKNIPMMKIEMARLLRANRAAEELNLTVRQLRTLRAGGFVKTVDSGLSSSSLYHIEELKAFKDNLKQVSHSVDILPENTMKFISVLIRFNVSPLVLLSRILTQNIGPVMYSKGSCSLYELYFDREHLEKIFSQSTEHGMSLKDVSKKLALNSTAIAYLIKERVIHVAKETKLSGCIQIKAVCPKSIEKFDLKYVSLKKFCMEQDKPMVSVVCKIKKMKIKPIVPGKHTSKIYRRSEIEMI